MATWMEIRCERRGSGKPHGPERCLSDDNAGPMEMADDTRESVLTVLKLINDQARESGWKKTREGWVCPACTQEGKGNG